MRVVGTVVRVAVAGDDEGKGGMAMAMSIRMAGK